jgi:hypothetical protein
MTDCSICCLAFTKSLREKITCPYCNHEACVQCVQRFLIDGMEGYLPRCMSCQIHWNQEFVDSVLPKTFRFGPLKSKREDTLLDQQRALLPATTVLVEKELLLREQTQQLRALVREKSEYEAKIRDIRGRMYRTSQTIDNIRRTKLDIEDAKKRQFIRSCPNEDCRGYLTTQWRCDLCHVRVCKECHEIRGDPEDGHVCKPENVQSALALARETRPCPNCGARISKIDGCDQMFCVVEGCHTAFSWRTGRVERGRIHNPHYYEWLRNNSPDGQIPREPGDDPCGGGGNRALPGYHAVRARVRETGITFPDMDAIHRVLLHIQYAEVPTVNPRNVEDTFSDLRVRYLIKEIDLNTFKQQLFRRHKAMEKKQTQYELYEMLLGVGSDLFRKYMTSLEIGTIRTEFEALRKYFNAASHAIAKRYGSATYNSIRENWEAFPWKRAIGQAPEV